MINMNNDKFSYKRKWFKLECLECDKMFDNDYKQKYEKVVHNCRIVSTKHFGALKNSFDVTEKSQK